MTWTCCGRRTPSPAQSLWKRAYQLRPVAATQTHRASKVHRALFLYNLVLWCDCWSLWRHVLLLRAHSNVILIKNTTVLTTLVSTPPCVMSLKFTPHHSNSGSYILPCFFSLRVCYSLRVTLSIMSASHNLLFWNCVATKTSFCFRSKPFHAPLQIVEASNVANLFFFWATPARCPVPVLLCGTVIESAETLALFQKQEVCLENFVLKNKTEFNLVLRRTLFPVESELFPSNYAVWSAPWPSAESVQ